MIELEDVVELDVEELDGVLEMFADSRGDLRAIPEEIGIDACPGADNRIVRIA